MTSGQENASGILTCKATAAAIAAGIRVTFDSSGTVSAAGATDPAIGVTLEAVAASGYVPVKLFTAPGTFPMQGHSTWAVGALLYPAAAGRVDDAGSTALGFQALEACTAQGDIIQCARILTGA